LLFEVNYKNSVSKELRVRRFADIQEKTLQSSLKMGNTWVKVARMEWEKN